MRKGFTLIELLIVVAIIAILAAIAVPNFLEAQTRAKVSRVKADQRSIVTGLEAYRVDHNDYVPGMIHMGHLGMATSFYLDKFVRWRLVALTTPVAYMTSLPTTPFLPKEYWVSSGSIPLPENLGDEYDMAYEDGWYNNLGPVLAGSNASPDMIKYHLRDAGPDYVFANSINGITNQMPYDATNGTKSIGDIWRFGP